MMSSRKKFQTAITADDFCNVFYHAGNQLFSLPARKGVYVI